jgi:hypothetical protein
MKGSILKFFISFGMIAMLLLLSNGDLLAQCPMCRMSAESNLANGGTAGAGLNAGILYMLATPYLLVAVVGFIWYKNRQKDTEEIPEEA